MNNRKLTERKFAVPMLSFILAIANDAAGMGLDWKVLVIVVAGSLAYSLIETWKDVTAIKYAPHLWPKEGETPKPPKKP